MSPAAREFPIGLAAGLPVLLAGVVLLTGDAFGDGPADRRIGDLLFLGVAVGSGLTHRKAVPAARAAAGPAARAMPEVRP